jgi:sugar lactone lactonase YvrE
MTLQKSRAVSTLISFAAALVLFLPITGTAQTQESTGPNAFTVTPQLFRFTDGDVDRSNRMTTDAAGNFYIAANLDNTFHHLNGFGVLKYNPQGKLLGAFHYKPKSLSAGFANDVKVDASGNIYAGGFTSFGALIMSFDPSGKTRWTHLLRNANQVDALALDQSGNVYAGGHGGSMIVAKFTANGKLLWQRLHQGTAPGSGVTDVQLDSKGNLIVFGDTTNAGPGLDTTILKINPQGNLLWTRNFTQSPDFDKVPRAGAVDHNDSIYATGDALDRFTGDSFPYTLKYDTNGNLSFLLTGAGIGGSSVAVDPAGKILLTGSTLVQSTPTWTASKFDPSGKRVWVTQIPLSAQGEIVSDAKGNVFVSGSDYTVTKLNGAGTIIWSFQGSSEFAEFVTTGSVVDPFGNLLVTGAGFDSKVVQDEIVTLKFLGNSKPHAAQWPLAQ